MRSGNRGGISPNNNASVPYVVNVCTMPTRQHHYVPKSYLKRFASKPKRINLFNLSRQIAREDISIKDQCRKPNYYGDQSNEDALTDMETAAGRAINHLISRPERTLPTAILRFVAMQRVRTPASVDSTVEAFRKMFELMASPRAPDVNQLKSAVESYVTPELALTMADELANAVSDLRFKVLSHPESVFITSDNPAFFYNQYCEQAQNTGIAGADRLGLQIFLPLSPRHLLMLYDGGTYDYVNNGMPTESDVEALNGLQIVTAEHNIYFADWHQLSHVVTLTDRFAKFRTNSPSKAEEIASDQNENESLIHGYLEIPNVGLELSILRLKKRALRVSMEKRLNGTRLRPRKRRNTNRNADVKTYSTVIARI